MLSPISLVAAPSTLKLATSSGPTACAISATHASEGLAQLPFFTNAAVGVPWPLSATRVRPSRMRNTVSLPPVTVTKLGQKPLRQLVSLLQVLWLIVRLRPNSVSSGSTDRQLLLALQSPQPSHTRSLMTTRTAGSSIVPRLRRRRFSVAHV